MYFFFYFCACELSFKHVHVSNKLIFCMNYWDQSDSIWELWYYLNYIFICCSYKIINITILIYLTILTFFLPLLEFVWPFIVLNCEFISRNSNFFLWFVVLCHNSDFFPLNCGIITHISENVSCSVTLYVNNTRNWIWYISHREIHTVQFSVRLVYYELCSARVNNSLYYMQLICCM